MDPIFSKNMREFLKQEERAPDVVARRIAYLVERGRTIDGLICGELVAVPASEEVQRNVAHLRQWNNFFDGFEVRTRHFNATNFPLGDDPGDEVEAFSFERDIRGYDAMRELQRMGREGASLWAVGRYFSEYRRGLDLYVAVGVQCTAFPNSLLMFERYSRGNDYCGRSVAFCSESAELSRHYRFLVRRKRV